MRGFILFIIAVILATIVLPASFIIGIFVSMWKGEFSSFMFDCAYSLDQTGNVFCQYVFNPLLRKENGYRYGNPDETISSATGKNYMTNDLKFLGNVLRRILDWLTPNHCIDSIEKNP